MTAAPIRMVAIYSDETVVEGRERSDVGMMLELVVDVADWASKAKTATPATPG